MPVRKITAGYCNVTSKVPSFKLQRMVDAESSLERDFFVLIDNDGTVEQFEEQPLVLSYDSGTYTPDALVHYKDNSRVLYEVKYRNELFKNWHKFKLPYRAAYRFCRENGMRFKIITEIEIRTPRLQNLKFLSHFIRTLSATEGANRNVLMSTLFDMKEASPKELLAACFSCKQKRAQAAPVLWRLIADGTINVDLFFPLTMHSPLSLCDELKEGI